jgi:RimJ/RimL family protein N-acetyltransferase
MNAPKPAKGPPQRVVLEGRYVRLEPIGEQHVASLYAAASSGDGRERFIYLFEDAPATEADMAAYVQRVSPSNDPLVFAVVDSATGRAEGRQSLMRIVPEHGVIELGGIYWGPNMARSRLSTEALFLHARCVFDALGYRRFEWKCNNRNAPSKAAAERFGFQFEGIFRQHMIQKGENRDTAWFAMLDQDWPRLEAEYERWLNPLNFDADGRQKTKLRFSEERP